MPDERGYEILPSRAGRYQPHRNHLECGRNVPNTPDALAAHLEECPARQATRARQAAQRADATARLAVVNEQRREARQVAPPPPADSLF